MRDTAWEREDEAAHDYPDKIGHKAGETPADGIAVRFQGKICRPRFNSAGAAQAYLDALQAGTRTPEFEEAPQG